MDNLNKELTYGQDRTFAVLMRNVYSWMALALLITALTAMVAADSQLLISTFATTPWVLWGLCIAELILVLTLSAIIGRISLVTATLMFVLYAVMNGITLSHILLIYTRESITQAFAISAGTFACMSLLGYMAKRELPGIGRILTMALVGLIVATFVNWFMKSEGMAIIINYLGVLIFVGLTAYDTQKIKRMMKDVHAEGVNDNTNKLAVMCSLMLYLDFINLFLYLLKILGKKR